MKTKKKVLLALLSATCITAGAFGLAACGGGDDRNADVVNVYNQYVAYAEANGETPVSYETWLNSIKGQPGSPGAAGKSAYELYRENYLQNNPNGIPMTEAAWLESLKGANGKGIEKVELNADQTKLVVTYTDGSSEEVDLPEAFAHVHDYGDDYVTVVAPTASADGLGYLTCEDCGHKELLAIKPYKVTVYQNDGKTPAADANVTINGETVGTDTNGVATFTDLKLGSYNVTVEKTGYTMTDAVQTSLTESEYKIVLAEELDLNSLYGVDVTPGSAVGDKKTFHLTAQYTSSPWTEGWTECSVYLEGASSGYSRFKLTFDGEYGDLIYNKNYSEFNRADIETDGAILLAVGPDDTVSFKMTVSNQLWDDAYDYAFTVERVDPPKDGEKDVPIAIALEQEVTRTAEPNEEVYFKVQTEFGKLYGFEFGSGVTVTALDGNADSAGTVITSGSVTVNGVYGYYYLKAKSADGNISFKVKRVYRDGEQGNPYNLALGATATAEVNMLSGVNEVWFKHTVSSADAGKYTLEMLSGDYFGYKIYKGPNPLSAELITNETSSEVSVLDFSEGTYYIVITTSCSFRLRTFDAATDTGYSKELPKEVTDGTITLTSADDMYFKYIVPQNGVFTMSAPKDGFQYVSYFTVYSDDSYSAQLFSVYSDDQTKEVTAGDVLYFTASAGYVGETHTVTFGTFSATDKVANTLVIKDDDGAVLAGVSVTVNEETATTNANGEVTFNLVPESNYTVAVDFGANAANYVYSPVALKKTYVPCTVDVVVKKVRSFTVNVKLGSEAAGAGITVSYGSYSAQTDENGVATLAMPNPENDYTALTVRDIPAGYECAGTAARTYVQSGVCTYELVLTALPITITGNTAEVKAGQAYKLSIDSDSSTTLTVSAGHIVTCTANNSISINGLSVFGGSLENFANDGVGYTMIEYWPFSSETLTIVFSEDATLTIS